MKSAGTYLTGAVAIGMLLAWPGDGHAQEWTRFRGPNGSGIGAATAMPVTVTEADYNWRVRLPGSGHSSPVLWGRKLFLTSAEETQGKRHLLCLDAADGRTLWTRTYDFAKYAHHQFNSFAASTPAVDAERVYILWTEPAKVSLHALDHNGREVWMRELGSFRTVQGAGASPIVVGDVVIVAHDQESREPDPATGAPPESFWIGLDCKTGAVRWKTPYPSSPSAAYGTPILYQPEGSPPEVIFSSIAHGITSLDPRTGERNWSLAAIFTERPVASPVLSHGLLFQTVGSGGGEKQLVVVRPGSKAPRRAAEVAYRMPRDISYVPTPVAYGDHVFFLGDGGVMTIVKAATGEQVAKGRVGGTFFGSPVCVNGKLYAMDAKGDLVVVEASERMTVLGRSPLGEGSHATPAIAGGVMYLRTMSHLISVGGRGRRSGEAR
jgi:outer membrane protein assembly factor BamB